MKGGVALSQGNQSCLRFSLEESVWFQRGQEVAELVSISLDPNITIQENEQYVSLLGSLELTGEYTCSAQQQEGEEDGITALKYVHSVMEREDGVCEFVHRFPIDITIPRNRIESIYDIDINVEAFDYDFPEKVRLKLTADLAITGLYGEQQHEAEQEEDSAEGNHKDTVDRIDGTEEDLHITYRDEADGLVDEPAEETEQVFDFPEAPAFSFVTQKESMEHEEEEEKNESDLYVPFRAEAKKTGAEEKKHESLIQPEEELQSVPEYASSDFRSEMESPEKVEEQGPAGGAGKEKPQEQEEGSPDAEIQEVAEESSSSSDEVMKKKKPNMKKGISIAEFLARKDEAADVAKIRVCIVQQGDTIQLISERYDVSVQQLLKVNNLSLDHEVSEGQVLYVPGTAVQVK